MDKASAYEAEDSGFEPRHGFFLLFFHFSSSPKFFAWYIFEYFSPPPFSLTWVQPHHTLQSLRYNIPGKVKWAHAYIRPAVPGIYFPCSIIQTKPFILFWVAITAGPKNSSLARINCCSLRFELLYGFGVAARVVGDMLLLYLLPIWHQQCLPGRWKPDVLRPGIVGVRGSMGKRLRPCMIMSTHPRWRCLFSLWCVHYTLVSIILRDLILRDISWPPCLIWCALSLSPNRQVLYGIYRKPHRAHTSSLFTHNDLWWA